MESLSRLPELLARTNKLYISILTEELERWGITKPQILVLEQLKEGPRTVGEISKRVDLSYSTVSGIIDRLERASIVVRKRDEKDRRVVWVSPVVNIPDLHDKFPFLHQRYYDEMFAGMTDEEAAQICQSLELLARYLERKRAALMQEKGSERT